MDTIYRYIIFLLTEIAFRDASLTNHHARPSKAMAKMPTARGSLTPKRDSGPRSPKSILVAQYSLLVSIGTGIAGVTYFTISGPGETVNLVGNAVNVATVIALEAVQMNVALTDHVYDSCCFPRFTL